MFLSLGDPLSPFSHIRRLSKAIAKLEDTFVTEREDLELMKTNQSYLLPSSVLSFFQYICVPNLKEGFSSHGD